MKTARTSSRQQQNHSFSFLFGENGHKITRRNVQHDMEVGTHDCRYIPLTCQSLTSLTGQYSGTGSQSSQGRSLELEGAVLKSRLPLRPIIGGVEAHSKARSPAKRYERFTEAKNESIIYGCIMSKSEGSTYLTAIRG